MNDAGVPLGPDALLEGLFRHSADGVLIGRPDGALIRANPAACQMLGRSEAEILRLGRGELVVDDPELRAMLQARLAQGVAAGRILFRRADGSPFPVEVTSALIPVAGGETHTCTIFRDVTERERAERAAAESAALLRAVLDTIPDPIFLKDRESRFRFANQAVLDLLGKPREQVLGADDLQIYGDPAVAGPLMENDRRVMAGGRTEIVEEVVGTPAGSREFLSAKTPFRDASGQVVGLLGYAQALEPRRRAEELTALQAAIANLPIGVVIVELPADGRTRLVAYNQAYEGIVRAPPDAGTPFDRLDYRIFLPDRAAPLPPEAWPGPRAARTGAAVRDEELHLRRADGSWRILSASAAPVRGGAGPVRRAIAVLLDVTEARAARTHAEDQAAQLRVAVEVAGLGLWRYELASGAVTSSEAARRMAGFRPGEPADRRELWRARIHPEDRERVYLATEALLRRAGAGVPSEGAWRLRYVHGDGTTCWVDMHLRVLPDEAGRPGVLYGALRDATAEVQEQEQLRALTARLHTVREEENARVARDLHDDLGQALTALQMELRAIDEQVGRLGPPEAAGPIIDRVVSATDLASGTLRTVQRISQEIHPEVLGRLGLEAALRQELRRFAERTGLAVCLSLAPVALPEASARALFRIAQEALTNVARHAGARRVELRLAVEGGAATLEVLDDGRGLPPGGAGTAHLGLLGMRERARSVGGEVAVGPREGGGTAVRATVPLPPGP